MLVLLGVWWPLFVCQVQYVCSMFTECICPGVCSALLCVPVCICVASSVLCQNSPKCFSLVLSVFPEFKGLCHCLGAHVFVWAHPDYCTATGPIAGNAADIELIESDCCCTDESSSQ